MQLLTVREAAKYLRIGESRVRQLVRAKRLGAVRIGERVYLIEENELKRFERRPPGRPPKKHAGNGLRKTVTR